MPAPAQVVKATGPASPIERVLAASPVQPIGGEAADIRPARLKRCLHELSEPRALRRSVIEVAIRCGFTSRSHFRRLFRANFGITPSATIEQARATRCLHRCSATACTSSRFPPMASSDLRVVKRVALLARARHIGKFIETLRQVRPEESADDDACSGLSCSEGRQAMRIEEGGKTEQA